MDYGINRLVPQAVKNKQTQQWYENDKKLQEWCRQFVDTKYKGQDMNVFLSMAHEAYGSANSSVDYYIKAFVEKKKREPATYNKWLDNRVNKEFNEKESENVKGNNMGLMHDPNDSYKNVVNAVKSQRF